MTELAAIAAAADAAPSCRALLYEAVLSLPGWFRPRGRLPEAKGDRSGPPVLVIPGFLADDHSTAALRHRLCKAGYQAFGWGRDRQYGVTEATFEHLIHRMDRIDRRTGGERVSLVGWSLGGLVAREFARRHPERVRRVITLGSPVVGDLRRNNNIWWLYEMLAGHRIGQFPFRCSFGRKPPVETIAIWSPLDGVVAPWSAAATGSCDRAIEVDCRHLELVSTRSAAAAVLSALGGPVADGAGAKPGCAVAQFA